MKVAALRRHKVKLTTVVGHLLNLAMGVIGALNFHGVPSGQFEILDQRSQFGSRHAVLAGVSQNGDATKRPDPGDSLAHFWPEGFEVANFAVIEVFAKGAVHVLAILLIDQPAGKVGAANLYLIRVQGKAVGAVFLLGDSVVKHLLKDLLTLPL